MVSERVSTIFFMSLKEKLSLQQIRTKDIYNKNAHVNKFYKKRKDILGKASQNSKFVSATLNADGSADFAFVTKVTPYEETEHQYVKIADITNNTLNNGKLETNNTGEYMMLVKINDFWDLLDQLSVIENNEFDKQTLSTILELSQDVKYCCECASFVYTGIAFYATLEDACLLPNNIPPEHWDKLRGGAVCCKHLSELFRTMSFQIPQMAQSIKKNMKQQGLLN